jgi:nitrate/nitrite transporter NarK
VVLLTSNSDLPTVLCTHVCAGGVSASHLDIAPRHAGVVFGVGNTAGTLAGLVAVPGLGYVLQHTGDWSLAFGLAAAHNVVGALLWARWVGDKPLPEDGDQLPDTPAGTTTDAAAAAAAAVLKPKMA